MKTKVSKKDIAIIGMAGIFPESEDVNQLWENLLAEKELIHFYDEKELEKPLKEKYVYADALMPNSDNFDHTFFGFSREEALFMDPQLRKFIEITWTAIEDAGYNVNAMNKDVGVFTAASDNLNWRAFVNFSEAKTINSFYQAQIANKNYLSTLLSYNFGFTGPSYSINTACSSSLTAIHIACRHLLLRECSMAIAGGIRITSTIEKGYQYAEGMILSKDGHCRPFDENASGTIFGEGGGAVILKRLEDAIEDKDQIYAVIKASATNNDGANKIGFTAPGVEGQFNCIKKSHQFADIDPSSITFIEGHGTGTNLGDGIEVNALNNVFKEIKNKSCPIGSIKSNLGHLDAASGVAGIIKASLAIQNKMLPASINYTKENTNTNFNEGPFYVNKKTISLKGKKEIIRAGVSSFGMGGTNAHVILEEYYSDRNEEIEKEYELLPFSAKSIVALKNYENNISEFLNKTSEEIQNIAYTLKTGRADFKYKGYCLVKGKEIIKSEIKSDENKNTIVFTFPGQGSQTQSMGKKLYETFPYYKQQIDEGITFLNEFSEEDFKSILFNNDDRIHKTRYTQPLLFLVEYAIAKMIINWGVAPDYMIGHSLGEYTAACISGVFTLKDALKILSKRGELMGVSGNGKMISVYGNIDEIKPYISGLDIAVVNTSNNVVFSGTILEIEVLQKQLNENGIVSKILKTSNAFHSKHMDAILDEFTKVVDSVVLKTPKTPFISNVTGNFVNEEDVTTSNYWKNQLRQTVQFKNGINTILEKEPTIYIEIGPGRTLINMFAQESKNTINTASTLAGHNETEDDELRIQKLLGKLFLHGTEIDWETYYKSSRVRKVSTPTYPFDAIKFPVKVNPLAHQELKKHAISSEVFKLDNSANSNREQSSNYIAPVSQIEKDLIVIWEEFFELKKVGVEDNYFELGGNSLQAVVLINRINKEFNTNLLLENLYEALTIKELSRILEFSVIQNKMSKENHNSQDREEILI